MTKMTAMFLATGGLLLASAADAQETGTRGGFEVGAELYDYRYRERDEGAVVVRDDGTFGAATLGYVETLGSGWFLSARLTLGWGSVDYRSDEGSRLSNVAQDMGQLELLAGRDFGVGTTTVTPFFGVGARAFNDNSGGRSSTDGLAGYDREISYGYLPAGINLRVPVGGRASLAVSGQVNLFVDGEVVSRFADIDPELPNVKLDLKDGTGWAVAAAMSFPVGSRRISIGPFARGWHIDRSKGRIFVEPEGSFELYEPKSRTLEGGLRMIFAF